MQLSFPALPGEDYFLDYCADLTLADWLPVRESGPATGNTATFSGLQIGQYGAGYYRVRWAR